MPDRQPKTIADRGSMSRACEGCTWRRDLPGDTHSACYHPLTARAHANDLAPLISAIGHTLPWPSPPGLDVAGDPHGITMGWFAWPWNFSPVWLVSCSGFAPRDRR
jgi:hypothetical protein